MVFLLFYDSIHYILGCWHHKKNSQGVYRPMHIQFANITWTLETHTRRPTTPLTFAVIFGSWELICILNNLNYSSFFPQTNSHHVFTVWSEFRIHKGVHRESCSVHWRGGSLRCLLNLWNRPVLQGRELLIIPSRI